MVLSALAMTLVGCTTAPKVVYRTTVVAASDEQLRDCSIDAPPTREEYLAATLEEREKLLTELNRANVKNLGICNSRLKEARRWNKEQKDLYKDRPIPTSGE